jgi:aldehyde dehydrogenase (NAD+)/aldehyde dehydrogenase (NAD(P)+)
LYWGKVLNAGQTCVAPDYVLVPRTFQATLVDALKKKHEQFYPDGPKTKDAYARLVNSTALNRLKGYLDNTKGKIVVGGEIDLEDRYLSPTIVSDVPFGDALLQE